MKVFFGGSRKVTGLNQEIRERIDSIIKQGFTILIGDANGADKSMQKHLAERGYKKVVVYCMGDGCRNNIGQWEIRTMRSNREHKDFSYYAIKDLQMSEEATFGFMIWDGKSKGTLNNVLNLIERNKKVLVYFFPSNRFYDVSTFRDLDSILIGCDKKSLEIFDKSLNIKERSISTQSQLSFA
jgi:hypothetical protein